MSEWVLIIVLSSAAGIGNPMPAATYTGPLAFESSTKCEAAGEELQRRLETKFNRVRVAWACIEQRRS